MTFTYNNGVPAAPNNPSVDQPDMLTNTQSIDGILGVDHVSFNALSGGTHLQTTFSSKNPALVQTDPQSVLYTNNVMATATNTASASTVAEMFYRNQNGILPVSMVKGFGSFDGGGNPLNTFNLSITLPGGHSSTGVYTIDIPPNIVTGTNYQIFIGVGINLLTPAVVAIYSIISAVQFQIAFRNVLNILIDPGQFSVLVMQL